MIKLILLNKFVQFFCNVCCYSDLVVDVEFKVSIVVYGLLQNLIVCFVVKGKFEVEVGECCC